MNWEEAKLISDLEAEREWKLEEVKIELANQTVKINSLLLLAHEAGLRPQIRNTPVMHKGGAEQIFIFMGQET